LVALPSFAVNVYSQVLEVVDQFLKVLRFDLRERQRDTVAVECIVQLLMSLGGDEAGQADPSPQQLHGHADVHRGQALVPRHGFVGLNQHAEIFGLALGLDLLAGGTVAGLWLVFKRGDEPLGFVRGDLSGGEHFKNLAAIFVHGIPHRIRVMSESA